jgi:O-antigen ligase
VKSLKEWGGRFGFLGNSDGANRLNSFLFHSILLASSLLVSYVILSRAGVHLFAVALGGIFFGTIYTVVSFGNLMVPFLVWILSICGFRFLFSVQTAGLPDLYLDRIALIWLVLVFFVKYFAENRKFRGPFTLEWLLVANGLYVLLLIYIKDMRVFHDWTMSYFIPYAAFFFAKNLVTSKRDIRKFLWVLLALVSYYDITSVAEKFSLHFLVWPKYILDDPIFIGRSNGPFMHAPLFGTVIAMMVPVHLYFIATVRSNLAKVLLYLGLAMGFAGLYFTYTRGSWLAGVGAILVVAFLNRRHFLKIVAPVLVVVPVVAILFLGLASDKFMKARVENEDTIGGRLGTLVTALKVWQANPIFGIGLNQYRYELDNYIAPVELPIIGTVQVRQFRNNPPHDIYISRLAETGLVGIILEWSIYLAVFMTFLRHYRRQRLGDKFAIYILPIFAGVFVAYLIGGLAIEYRFFSVVGTLFFSCAGILHGYRPEEDMDEENPDRAGSLMSSSNPSSSNQVDRTHVS